MASFVTNDLRTTQRVISEDDKIYLDNDQDS